MHRDIRQRIRSSLIALALLAGAAGAAHAQRATIRGTVRDLATQAPLGQVQVTLGGSTMGVLTDAEGRYRIGGVPSGAIEVRARFIGYRVSSQTVVVPAEGEVEVNFGLTASALGLDEIVITASGAGQAAKEQANALTNVNLEDIVPTAPITNMTDALNARAPGVAVMSSGGTTGGGTRIRVRGSNSVSLSNEPVIFIDGVRVESGASSNTVGVGGQVPSRINDINPEEIASYDLIRGPSAATLYGTAAANGIISIRTKRGRSGAPVWRAYMEGGSLAQDVTWPDNYFGFDTTQAGTSALRYGCTLSRVEATQCTQNGGLFLINPLRDDSPFRTGDHVQGGLSVSGGGERVTYFLSSDLTRENGVYRNNDLKRINMRANVNAAINRLLDVGVQTGYVSSDLRLPDNDNNALGFLGSGLLGRSDTTRNGWGFLLPSESYQIQTAQDVERFTGSVTADYRPLSWLTARAVAGLDHTTRFDQRTFPPNVVPFNATTTEGSRAANPVQIFNYTGNVSATARFRLNTSLTSNTTAGAQYFRDRSITVSASGRKLAAGTTSLGGIGIPTVSENQQETKTLGLFVEEVFGIRDRLFLTAAIRQDDNSAFGQDFGGITYPKVGASYVISDESFFPRLPALSSLRLRSAYGASGLAPGSTDAILFFDPVQVTTDNADQVAFQVGNLGNPDLKPERSAELELGFDAGLFNDRMRMEFTYFNKTSHDALIQRILAPSLGVVNAQFYNLGEVNNSGFELGLTGRVLDSRRLAVDLGVSIWSTRNRLIDLGQDFQGNEIPDIVFGTQRHREGFPLGSYFTRPIVDIQDTVGGVANGIITTREVRLDTAFQFVGSPFPTRGWTFAPAITLFERFRIGITLDHRGGHYLYNLTGDFRCRQNICPEANDPTTPVQRQAEMVSAVFLGQPNGYIEKADFTKLRELSLTFFAPQSWARAARASAMSFTVAGRNLVTWTDYTGFDPEVNQNGQANFTTTDFLTQPPVRYWTARVNYTF